MYLKDYDILVIKKKINTTQPKAILNTISINCSKNQTLDVYDYLTVINKNVAFHERINIYSLHVNYT